MRSELEKVVREEIKQKLMSSFIIKNVKSSPQTENEVTQNTLISLTDISNVDKNHESNLTLK